MLTWLHKKLAKVSKSSVSCGFDHIYWGSPQWKPSVFVHCILLMVEQGIRGGICHSIYRYAKTNNRIYFSILLKDTSQFNEDL